MSDTETNLKENVEYRVLQAMKMVLTDVIKDTTTKPGMIHPLSDRTIEGMRECLKLISARERELSEAAGIAFNLRPRYVDEPKKTVVVPLQSIGKNKNTEK